MCIVCHCRSVYVTEHLRYHHQPQSQPLFTMENSTVNQSQSALNDTTLPIDESTTDVHFYLSLCIGGFGAVDNLLVILVLSSSPLLRGKIVNMFIINQSLIDLASSIVMMANTMTTFLEPYKKFYGILGYMRCILWHNSLFMWGLFSASTFNLVGLTIDRYVKIVHPMWYKKHCLKRHSVIAMSCAWGISIGLKMVVKIPTSYVDDNHDCNSDKQWPSAQFRQGVAIILFCVEYFIPFLIILSCYVRIVLALCRHLKPAANMSMGASDGREMFFTKALKNTLTTLALVASFYVVCWTTNEIYLVMYYFGYQVQWFSLGPKLSMSMVYFNLCVNPIIYGFTYKPFQERMKSFFIGGDMAGSRNIHTPSSSMSTTYIQ